MGAQKGRGGDHTTVWGCACVLCYGRRVWIGWTPLIVGWLSAARRFLGGRTHGLPHKRATHTRTRERGRGQQRTKRLCSLVGWRVSPHCVLTSLSVSSSPAQFGILSISSLYHRTLASLLIMSSPHPAIEYVGEWPQLNDTQLGVIIGINVGVFILSWILLRLIWKPPTEKQLRSDNTRHTCYTPVAASMSI